jgi:ankyrin repeat protein
MTSVDDCRNAMGRLSDAEIAATFRECVDRNALVLYAVGASNIRAVRLLIAENFDLNFNIASGAKTLLHFAFQYSTVCIVDMLVAAGANVDAVDESGSPPWHFAALNRDETVMAFLVQRGFDVDSTDAHGVGLLHLAAETANYQVLHRLIAARGNVNAPNHDGRTPLHCASVYGSSDCVSLLLRARALSNAKDNAGLRPLHLTEDPACAALLIGPKRANNLNARDSCGWTACHYAWNRPLVLQVLIGAGARVSVRGKRGETALHVAASKEGGIGAISMLIAAGASVNQADREGYGAGHWAARAGRVDNLKILLENGVGIDELSTAGETLLYVAAHAKHIDIVRALIDAGADPNIRTEAHMSPLDVSLMMSCFPIAKLLVNAGASARGDSAGKRSTCHIAAQSPTHAVDLLRLVIGAGADVHAIDAYGASVMHGANASTLPLLVSLGLSLNARDNGGCTPCHTSFSNSKVLMTLFALGANMTQVNYFYHTPYENTLGRLHFTLPHERGEINDALLTLAAVGLGFGAQAYLHQHAETAAIVIAGGGHVSAGFDSTPLLARRSAGIDPAWLAQLGLPAGFDSAALMAEQLAVSTRFVARQKQLMRLRAYQVCIGLQNLRLPALQTCEILAFMFAPMESSVPFHVVWNIVETIKHFKERQQRR